MRTITLTEKQAAKLRRFCRAALDLAEMVERHAQKDFAGILGERALRAEERLAALTAAAGEAADLLGIVASYVGSEGDAGLGQIKWARDARRVETALRVAMGEEKSDG